MSDDESVLSRPVSPVSAVPDLTPTTRPYRFTWDPASRRPGPESVSGTTEGRGGGDYFSAQPRLGLLNTSSSATLILPQEWSSSKHGFHAISTVLNNPHKKQAPPKAHSSLPAVVPADLPRVRRKDFDSYLRAITPEWDRFQHRDGVAQLQDDENTTTTTSIPPLDTVPSIFFQPTFNLGDPRTFSAVTEQDPPLEQFSQYADTVEQHLILEISLRSTSFFAALTNLHDLRAESEHCLTRIAALRSLLTNLDENSAKRGLEVVRRQARADNLVRVMDGVRLVAGVVEMGKVARGLVGAGQWGEALNVIEEMERMWEGRVEDTTGKLATLTEEEEVEPQRTTLIPLSSLHAYTSLPDHLRALTTEIATSLSSDLVSVLRADLVERIRRSDHESGLHDRLRPLLHGLARTRGIKEGMLSWREVVLGEVRSVVKSRLPDDGALRSMRHPEFMLLLQDIYGSLLNCIEGLQAQNHIIQSVSDTDDDDLSDILSSAAELANTQAAAVISLRVEEHAALELAEFLVLFNASWGFVVRCEVICRRMIVGLRGVVVSQAKLFLQAFHQARISRSAKLVEDEQWNPAEISPSLQHITNIIVDSAVRDAPELVIKADSDSTPLSASATPPQPLAPHANGFGAVSSGANSKHLRIEGRTYFAVSATAEVLVLLLDYLRVVVNLTMLTTDTMSRVIEFLKAFNSRTCQVVLGAGAMRSAGLKNITAKHLALASQSLSIMSELIPYVRETFRRHLSPKQAVMLVEFDKLKRDYQEHQNEIHSKLIAIMGDRLTAHIKSLQAVDWNGPKPAAGVNEYMEILVKETVTLHKVLSRYLSTPVVEYVMTQVFAAINHGLSEEYGKIELSHQEAKNRLLADAKYLHLKLSALKNVGTPSNMLVTVISEKSLPRPPGPPGAPTPTRTSTFQNVSASANQRLKGLLSARSPTFDKALPTPVRTSSLSPSPSLLQPHRPASPGAHSTAANDVPVGNGNGSADRGDRDGTGSPSTSHVSQTVTQTQQQEVRKPTAGFKQVEIPLPKALESEPEPGPEASENSGGGGPIPETESLTDANRKTAESVLGREIHSSSPPPPTPPPHDTPPERISTPPEPGVQSRGDNIDAGDSAEGLGVVALDTSSPMPDPSEPVGLVVEDGEAAR